MSRSPRVLAKIILRVFKKVLMNLVFQALNVALLMLATELFGCPSVICNHSQCDFDQEKPILAEQKIM